MVKSLLKSRVLLLIGGCFLCMSSFTYANETNSTIRLPGLNVTSVCALGKFVYAGTEKHGVYASWNDGGQTFPINYTKKGHQLQSDHINDVTASAANGYVQLNVATDKGLDLRTAWGLQESWVHLFQGSSMASACSISKNDYRYNTSYALFSPNNNNGSRSTLVRKENIWKGWQPVRSNTNSVSVSPTSPSYVFANTDAGVFYTIDELQNWTQLLLPETTKVNSVAGAGIFVAVGTNDGVFTKNLGTPPWAHTLKGIKINKVSVASNGQILAATDNGLYFSSCSPGFGVNWDLPYTTANGLADNKINAACESAGKAFVATPKGLSIGKILDVSEISHATIVQQETPIAVLATSPGFIYVSYNQPRPYSGLIYTYTYTAKGFQKYATFITTPHYIHCLCASNGYLYAGCDQGDIYVYKIESSGALNLVESYNLGNFAIDSLYASDECLFAGYGNGSNTGFSVCKIDPEHGTLAAIATSPAHSGKLLNVISNGAFDYIYTRREVIHPDDSKVIVYKFDISAGKVSKLREKAFPNEKIVSMTVTNGCLYFACYDIPEQVFRVSRILSFKCTFDSSWKELKNTKISNFKTLALTASNGFLYASSTTGSSMFTTCYAECYKCNSDGTIEKFAKYQLGRINGKALCSALSADGKLYTGYDDGVLGGCRFRSLDFSGESSKKLAEVENL